MKKLTRILMLVLLSMGMVLPALAMDPMSRPNDTWISVDGTITTVTMDSFVLDYGEGLITVEMDDGDRDADAYALLPGDKVTVSGMIDDGLLENRTIEAASVYVEKLGTTFYASAMDEESMTGRIWAVPVVVVSQTRITGTVTEVYEEKFVIDTGARKITVTVETMPYNPLDDIGYQQVDVDDYVSVIGRMDTDLFEGREFKAESLVTIIQ